MARREQQEWQSNLEGARGMAHWISVYKAYNAIFKLTELALLPHGLSLPELYLLGVLKSGGGTLTTGEVGRAMVKASQTITGLVERVFDRRDRRKVWVRLTEKGDRKLEEAFPIASRLAEERGEQHGGIQLLEEAGQEASIS